MLHPGLLLLSATLVALLAGACGGGAQGQSCDDTHPCPDGFVCGPDGRCVAEGDGGAGDASAPDAGGGDGAGGDACLTPCGSGCCVEGEVCIGETCHRDLGECASNADCQEDSRCLENHCVPYGEGETNPDCHRLVVVGKFQPQLHCQWDGTEPGLPYPQHVQVLSAPVVVDFNFDGDVTTRRPSIVFASYNGLDGACGLGSDYLGTTSYGVIRVVDGKTCATLYTIDPADPDVAMKVNGASTPTVGDIDGDGRPEIVALSHTGGVVAFDYDPVKDKFVTKWTSRLPDGTPHNPGWNSSAGRVDCFWVGPSMADLDDDGRPEIVFGGVVYTNEGVLVDGSLGTMRSMSSGTYAVLADLDMDGRVELAGDLSAYSFDPAQKRWVARPYTNYVDCSPISCMPGWTAVADFGTFGDDPAEDDFTRLDGIAEIAVVGRGYARIQKLDGRVLFRKTLPGSTGGGPPTIGDFDGDGLPELAAAGSDSYTIFDPLCSAATPDPAHCATPRAPTDPSGYADGVLWTKVSQDHSSNITGSSIFDFEADGHVEAIYADECYVRVYDGSTGDVIFSQPHTSCTWHEYPIVADVDGSFQSKLVVPSNENCNVSCHDLDPNFAGLRCETSADCPSTLPCVEGFCRCNDDSECGQTAVGGGFFCRDAPAGTPGTGKTCRAGHVIANGTPYGVPAKKYHGIWVYSDVLDRWVSSRQIWSQHAYSITHITETGIVVRTSAWQQNFRTPGLNNFRANTQGSLGPEDSPDTTSRQIDWSCDESTYTLHLAVTMCNRGTAPVGAGTPLTFYRGDPSARVVLCTAETQAILMPGECEDVACDVANVQPNLEFDVTAVADDPGTGQPRYAECVGTNNTARATDVVCHWVG